MGRRLPAVYRLSFIIDRLSGGRSAGQAAHRPAAMHTVGIGLELRIGCEICKFLQGFLIQRQLGLLHNKAPSFNSEVAAKADVLVHPRGRSTRQMAFGLDGIMGGKEVVGPVISQVSQGFLVQCQLAGFLFHGKAPS